MNRLPAGTALPIVLLLGALLSGCGEQTGGTGDPGAGAPSAASSTPNGLVPDGYDGRFRATAYVVDEPEHGPQLCAGGVADTYPPGCSGLDLVGWTWDGLVHESASGTRWGTYVVTGTYDGTRFTVTEPATVAQPGRRNGADGPDFTSPCPEPAGGWKPIDPDTATEATYAAATRLARASADFAGLWIDQPPFVSEETANDPQRIVLNVMYTGNLTAHERELREVWGGALCVSPARNRYSDLEEIFHALSPMPGSLVISIDELDNVVDLLLIVADEATQRSLDEQYGPGVVRLSGFLQPID